ncbi:hypothetical protein [Acuticoccus mangrovi]|uniref:Secreted protein n=1 Tax=Acuticoccus mangrovi TaxID=2796142 RepID=A0A934MEK7_9HYPH|nr:hypothetical protein [Acuticoccus mangrovi]MBJ3774478.1 hypothetical protein [Acuticoccus mangrovi]
MKTIVRTALAAAALSTAFAGAATTASAQGINTQFLIADIKSATPSCHDFPEYGVVGRVSGIVSGTPSRGVSFVGCFPSFGSCEAWKGPVSGKISGRLTLSTCDYR